MSNKRRREELGYPPSLPRPPLKRTRNGTRIIPGKVYRPEEKHRTHRHSGVGRNFHSVPYPLTLLPYHSWSLLHHRAQRVDEPATQFPCPKCMADRKKPTPHQRKLFLVAERLSWNEGTVTSRERMKNEEGLWEVNFELGIKEPAVEGKLALGGKESKAHPFYPFHTEKEAEAALTLLKGADKLSDTTFKLWLDMVNGFAITAASARPKETPPSRHALATTSGSAVNARFPRPTSPSSIPTELVTSTACKDTNGRLQACSSAQSATSARVSTAPVPTMAMVLNRKCCERVKKDRTFDSLINRIVSSRGTPNDFATFKAIRDKYIAQIIRDRDQIFQLYCTFFRSIPPQLFLKVAHRAALAPEERQRMESVKLMAATATEHALFKQAVDECYWEWQKELERAGCVSTLSSASYAGSAPQSQQASRIHRNTQYPGSVNHETTGVEYIWRAPRKPDFDTRPQCPAPALHSSPSATLRDAAKPSSRPPTQAATYPTAEPPVERVTAKYRSLPDLYRLLDQIERTSYMGKRFLETYADYLANDACTDCWFERNRMSEDEFEAVERDVKQELE